MSDLEAALLDTMRGDPVMADRIAAAHIPDIDGRCNGCNTGNGRVSSRDCFLGRVARRALAERGRP